MFFTISNLKSARKYKLQRVELSRKQFLLAPANLYCNFHILFKYILYTMLYSVYIHTVLSMLPFLFYSSRLKAGVVHSRDLFLLFKMLIIGQLQVQAATAENEEHYTLSNIVRIAFLW